jgi:hypothetical protein
MSAAPALAAARRCIAGAMRDPGAAAGLLGRAIDYINAALLSVTPKTPAAARAAIQAEADELSTYIQCFEEGT